MLLKMGTGMMLFAVALVAVVAVMVNLSSGEEPTEVATVEQQAAETPPDPGKKDRSYKEKSSPEEEPAGEPLKEPRGASPVGASRGESPAKSRGESPAKSRGGSPAKSRGGSPAEPSRESEADTLPVSSNNWPKPSREEVAAASGPRYYPPRGDAELTLTIESLEIYDAPVIDSISEEALEQGVIHVPETPMPWDERRQKNVYLAGHRLGYPETGSRMIFYNLDKLSSGDSIVLKDRSGNAYKYQVSEMFVVEPDAGWALDPVRDRDMVTLQTCTYPIFENRIIVRADRV